MRFVFTDSRHNLFHRLVVFLIRLASFIVVAPLSAYLGATGFMFSQPIIQGYLPVLLVEKVNFYAASLPYFPYVKIFIFNLLNHWYKDAPGWWTIVLGIPLIILGIDILVISFFDLYYSIFNSSFGRTHCPFCKKPIQLKKTDN